MAIPQINLYTDYMNILANDKEFLEYIEIWNKIKYLFNKRFNKGTIHKNEYIRTKISPFNENFRGDKKLIKSEYYETSILLIESICETENKYYPETFLE